MPTKNLSASLGVTHEYYFVWALAKTVLFGFYVLLAAARKHVFSDFWCVYCPALGMDIVSQRSRVVYLVCRPEGVQAPDQKFSTHKYKSGFVQSCGKVDV